MDVINKYLQPNNISEIHRVVKTQTQCTDDQFKKYLVEAFDAVHKSIVDTGKINEYAKNTSDTQALEIINEVTVDIIKELVDRDGPGSSRGEAIMRATNDVWQRQDFNPRLLIESNEYQESSTNTGTTHRPLEYHDKHATTSLEYNQEEQPSINNILANNEASSKKPLPSKVVHHTRQSVFDHIPYESRNNIAYSRHIPYTYMLDSRDRNTDSFPDPNDYYVDTYDVFRNVTSVGLMAAVIPNTVYNIYDGINQIHFEETNGVELIGVIEPGNYDNTTITTAVKNALENTVGANSGYTVTIDTATDKMTIVSDLLGGGGVFNLNFAGDAVKKGIDGTNVSYQQGSVGPYIGFAPTDLSGVNTYTGTGVVNLNTLPYMLLFIDNLEKYESTTEPHRAFCQILRNSLGTEGGSNTTSGQPYTLHTHRSFINVKHFSPPLAKLDRLKIRLTDYYGNVLNFNGADHSLLLEISVIEDIDRKI